MRDFLWVALGGALGSMARYGVFRLMPPWAVQGFPWPTFVVNVLGCLVAGVLLAMAEKHSALLAPWRFFLFTGVLGGFTTFSAFGLDTFALLRRGSTGVALAYVAASVLAGVLVLGLGYVWVAKLK